MAALRDLYSASGGQNWTWYNHSLPDSLHTGIPWDFSAPAPNPCHPQRWQGLVCSQVVVNNTVHIVAVELFVHNLRGRLPETFYNLTELLHINLADNELTGTLSRAVAQLLRLQTINVKINGLTGTVPKEIGFLPSLLVLDLRSNHFSGTIPSTVFAQDGLQYVNFGGNLMTGTLSDQIGRLYNLTTIDVSSNMMHGTIPTVIGNLSSLLDLFLYENRFTGTIPESLGQLHALESLEINRNLLTGTIPRIFSTLPALTILYLSDNHLHGNIPADLGSLVSLQTLYGYGNALSGPIPTSIAALAHATTIQLHENALTGSIEGLFSPSWQPVLELLQLNSNQLTGTIPDELFALPQLRTLVLGGNCFSGSLPVSACASPELSTLSLDGLRSASGCQRVMLPGLSSAYVLTDKIHGGVPACLFHKAELVTLHLSGNGLTGTLPNIANFSTKLMDIALSHNELTGTIPHAFQRRIWYNLDLSYNKFSGTLGSDVSSVEGNYTFADHITRLNRNLTLVVTAATLSLRNNRLSSLVPSTVLDMHNISILSGNLFDCQLSKDDLPAHDSAIDTYQCGSASFNVSYYVWLGCSFLAVAVVAVVWYWRRWLESAVGGLFSLYRITRWASIASGEGKARLTSYKYVRTVYASIAEVALWSTAFIVVVFLPLYAILSHLRATHTYTYAYTVSAAFLSGGVATGLMLTFFLVLVAALAVVLKAQLRKLTDHLSEHRDIARMVSDSPSVTEREVLSGYKRAAIYATFFFINFTVMIGVNIAYLYVVLYENSTYSTIAQISLSLFKLMWNNFGSQFLIRWTRRQVASTAEDASRGAGLFAIQLFVALFNYIAIPCLVVGVVNPDCFNSLFVNAPTVHTTFFYEHCKVIAGGGGGCALYLPDEGSSSYSPPFTYSYECSSSLIAYYAPSFIYMALIVTFVNPTLKAALLWAYQRRVAGTRLARLLEQNVPRVLQDVVATEHSSVSGDASNGYHRLFDANKQLVTLLTYLGVLLTFGLVFPPIAVAMLVSIYAVEYTSKIEVGRFLTNTIDKNLFAPAELVERECLGVGSVPKLRQAAMTLLTFTCFFYAPFLFDTLGDSVGAANASWVVALLVVLPGALYAAAQLYGTDTHSARASKEKSKDEAVTVEMQEVPKLTAAHTETKSSSLNGQEGSVVNALHAQV
jgi:Leucine-rich repeat (LRR) protein